VPTNSSVMRSNIRARAVVSLSLALLLRSGALSAEDAPQLPDVVDRAGGSVVSIVAEKAGTASVDTDTDIGKSNARQGMSLVLTGDGLIVTATSLLDQVGKITVTFLDGRQATVQVIGRDPRTGIALLKESTAKGLSPVRFADADTFRRGSSVFFIGNAYGLQNSLSAGVISAIRRHNVSHLILQTDMVVDPGSIGAPLFNMKGDVVGMFTSRYSVAGNGTGIGLAVSSNLLREVTDKLQKFGVVNRGWLGVQTRKPTDEEAHTLGMGAGGLIVVKVLDGGPAAAAGIKAGDGIAAFNGEPIQEPYSLGLHVTSSAPNTEVTLGLFSKTGRSDLRVKLGRLPDAPPSGASTSNASVAPLDKSPTCLRYIPSVGMTVAVACEE
jgi:serine protease Do